MVKAARIIVAIMLTGVMILAAAGCKGNTNPPKDARNPEVTFELDNGKKIVFELLPEYAPNTVANFVAVVQSGILDGTIFHRMQPGVFIQGGGVALVGEQAEARETDYSIDGEFANNGFEQNTLKHTRGIISMARTSDPNSAGSGFFIVQSDVPMWDNEYAAFGKAISGMEAVDEITDYVAEHGMDEKYFAVKKATVDTFGVDWPKPTPHKDK